MDKDFFSEIDDDACQAMLDPILIAAFEGWNDAGSAATNAVDQLINQFDAEQFAIINPEHFYNFQLVRPMVKLIDGITREIIWPENSFSLGESTDLQQDFIIFSGAEPQYRWRTFCEGFMDFIHQCDIKMVVTFGALLADVPHTRPVSITGLASDHKLVEQLGLNASHYEGPTGIIGVLHDKLRQSNIKSVSIWAPVPHYISVVPNPQASLALLEKFASLIEVDLDLDQLREDSVDFEKKVNEAMEDNPEIVEYVHLLEKRIDENPPLVTGKMPTGEELAAELEKFLKDIRGESS